MFSCFIDSMISATLVERAGKNVERQCKNEEQCIKATKKYRITHAGKLPCKNIVHLIINANNLRQELPTDLLEVFKVVNSLKKKSIAIPAIGTGKY